MAFSHLSCCYDSFQCKSEQGNWNQIVGCSVVQIQTAGELLASALAQIASYLEDKLSKDSGDCSRNILDGFDSSLNAFKTGILTANLILGINNIVEDVNG